MANDYKKKKISHYSTGNKWDKSKEPKKPKVVEVQVDSEENKFHEHQKKMWDAMKAFDAPIYYKTSMNWIYDDKPETVDLYTAEKMDSHVGQMFYIQPEIALIEGEQVIINKKSIPKNPGKEWISFFRYSHSLSLHHPPDKTLDEKLQEAITASELEESPLTLPDSLLKDRQKERLKQALNTLIKEQVEEHTAAHRRSMDLMNNIVESKSGIIDRLQKRITAREVEVEGLRADLENLRFRKAQVEKRTVFVDSARHFREEEYGLRAG